MTRTGLALATVLFAATSSTAFAQGYDPNLANRYQGLIQPYTYGYSATGALVTLQPPAVALQSAPVRAHRQRYGRVVRTGASIA